MKRAQFRNEFSELSRREGFDLTESQIEQFVLYWSELKHWNSKINLTAIRNDREIMVKHFLDSIDILKNFDIPFSSFVADVGSGAGFPGIPIKICRPDLKFSLIESSNKKSSFLRFMVSKLSLEDVQIIAQPVEDIVDRSVGIYDIVLTRYVASLAKSIDYAVPLLSCNGRWIAYKFSKNLTAEIESSMAKFKSMDAEIKLSMESGQFDRIYVVIGRKGKILTSQFLSN